MAPHKDPGLMVAHGPPQISRLATGEAQHPKAGLSDGGFMVVVPGSWGSTNNHDKDDSITIDNQGYRTIDNHG